mmetsp:Transcript_10692/g.10338  ORF Transcript_10692/g.10338 Transcript_10692/m.10338 type:complete len:234 (+) Transcript_10692:350-1051(+)
MFSVRESSIELLNDAGSEYTSGVKLHFQLRLKAKDFHTVQALHAAAQAIPYAVWEPEFKTDLVNNLIITSKKIDHLDYSRYGYLVETDVEVLNAMALPLGEIRDPFEIPMDEDGASVTNHIKDTVQNQIDLILLGVAIACLAVLSCVLMMYYRLKLEHAALEKDKQGGSLRGLWNRFVKKEGNSRSNHRYSTLEMRDTMEDSSKATVSKTNVPFSSSTMDDDELDEEDLGGLQ